MNIIIYFQLNRNIWCESKKFYEIFARIPFPCTIEWPNYGALLRWSTPGSSKSQPLAPLLKDLHSYWNLAYFLEPPSPMEEITFGISSSSSNYYLIFRRLTMKITRIGLDSNSDNIQGVCFGYLLCEQVETAGCLLKTWLVGVLHRELNCCKLLSYTIIQLMPVPCYIWTIAAVGSSRQLDHPWDGGGPVEGITTQLLKTQNLFN